MATVRLSVAEFEANAAQVAGAPRALSNERRLMNLRKLVEMKEATASALVEAVGVRQSTHG